MATPKKLVRGWVYVMSNPTFPDLVKIGFSTKDPHGRALELSSAGVPHPYKVEYDCLVHSPRDIEQRIHKVMAASHESKEWFRCSANMAIDAIRGLVKDGIIAESALPTRSIEPTPVVVDPLTTLFNIRRLKPRGQGCWTLSESSRLLVERQSGRRFASHEYTFDGASQVKGFALRDRTIPWVNLSDVELID